MPNPPLEQFIGLPFDQRILRLPRYRLLRAPQARTISRSQQGRLAG